MLYDERKNIRDSLFEKFIELRIITIMKDGKRIRINNRKLSLLNDERLLKDYNLYINEFRSQEEALYCLIHNDDYENHHCPICNELCAFHNGEKLYRKSCNKEDCLKQIGLLSYDVEKTKEAREKTILKKYGVKNVSYLSEIRKKAKETMIRLYGASNPMKVPELKERQKNTIKERYGVDNPFQSDNIKEKIKQTNLERYGVEYPMQSLEIKKKSVITSREHYKTDHPMQNEIHKKKVQQTLMEKYNTDNISKLPIIKDKIRERYYSSHVSPKNFSNQDIQYIINLINKENDKNIITLYDIYANSNYFYNFIIKLYNLKNRLLKLKEISKVFNIGIQSIKKRIKELKLLQYFSIIESRLEKQLKILLEENFINYAKNKSILTNSKEIDFLLEGYNIGIEINDLSTHNITYKHKDKYYHLNKTKEAYNNHIHLIHLWEWELTNKIYWSKISNWLINLLNKNKKLLTYNNHDYLIKEVNIEDEIKFINDYSIYNYKKSDICLGLYYNGELIQLLSINNSTINQMFTKYGFEILNGYKALLNYAIKTYNIKELFFNCNLDKLNTIIYEDIGFKLINSTEPNVIYEGHEEGLDSLGISHRKRCYDCGTNIYSYMEGLI